MPGYDRNDLDDVRSSRNKAIRKVRAHQKAIVFWRKIKARREKRIKQLRAKNDPVAVFCKFFVDRFGWHEDAGRPNRAGWLDAWARNIGEWMLGQPWCGLAVWMAARAAGVTLSPRTVSTVAIREMAQAAGTVGGWKAWHPATATPQLGWCPIYGTPSSGPVHVGAFVGNGIVGEGNTSPGAGGSQNNGGGLYPRKLSERRSWVLGYAEIDWSLAKR